MSTTDQRSSWNAPTPVEAFHFNHRAFLVKRDDVIDDQLNGNKARKFHSIWKAHPERYRRVLSHGGNQSNAMRALALLCHRKKWEFIYCTPPLPAFLRKSPTGNLQTALDAGMKLIETKESPEEIRIRLTREAKVDLQSLFVPMGGQFPDAEEGVAVLAEEIRNFALESRLFDFKVVLSSGTGTTALYLARNLPEFEIFTVPCVGDGAYLREQMSQLAALPPNLRIIEASKKFVFGRPDGKLLETWKELRRGGIEFDLLYDTLTWHTLRDVPEFMAQNNNLFIHSGGTEGNPTQLKRYERAGYEIADSICTSL